MKVSCYISIKTTVTPSKVVLSPPKVWLKFCKLIYCSIAQSYLTLHNPMDWSTPGFSVLHYLLEFAQNHVRWVDDAIQPSHPLSLLLLPSIFPSIRVFSMSQFFSSGDQSIGVSASSSVLPKNIQDWFPLGLTESPILTSIHDYWKNIALTRWTFVGTVMSLLLNMLSRLVITLISFQGVNVF